MAIVGTSYSDWMRQNPGIVDQASQRQQQQVNAQAMTAPPPAAQAVPTQVQPVAQPQAPQPQATVAPVSGGGTLINDPRAPQQQQGLGPINTPPDTGDKGYDGIANIAKMVASFYTGGLAGGAQTVATSGKSGGSNGAAAQGGDSGAGGALSILSQFMGK